MTTTQVRADALAERPLAGTEQATVRPATQADLAAVQAIYASHVLGGTGSFEEVPPSLGEIEARWRGITGGGLPYLVAAEGERLLGFAYAGPFRPRSAYRFTVEDSIYVAPDALGGGVGSLLLGALIDACEKRGMRQMIAVIGDSANTRSIRLHQRHGFIRAGTLVDAGYKFGRWLDAVFMQRTLTPNASPGRG
ncbi:MAG: N-acetyltransferase family protein [Rhodospirillales bacterium]|jgi:phosphinothricin acetyltransferase|nr:N-acetyltransferase family protein [Rhodospirillales bacterium]